jgi:formate transporter
MFMIPLGLLVKDNASAGFWSGAGLTKAEFADLTWSHFRFYCRSRG